MKRKRLPKSIRKFIRLQKARVRREVLDLEEQERLIKELYERFLKVPAKEKRKVVQKSKITKKTPEAVGADKKS
jgi:endonuclease V-like protein UPF0215 family